MKSSIIGKLFILLTVFLISIMAVSAADYTLSVYNLNLEVGANDEYVHTNDENNAYCKFKIASGSDLVAKGGFADIKVTWTVGSFELDSIIKNIEVKNIATHQIKKYLTSSPNWAQSGISFKVDDSLKCVASVHWENPNKQGDEPATLDSDPKEKSILISNTKPTLNFGSEDDFPTVTEGAVTEGKWEGTGTVKNKVNDIDTSSGQTLSFTATSSHPSDFSCSVNELELSYKLTNTNFNTDGKTAYCEVKVFDGKDPSNTDNVDLHINNDNADELSITSTPVSTATVDVDYEYKVTVSNPDGLTLTPTFEVKPDWLTGVKDKTTTGFTIYGKPTKEGTDAVVLVVKAGAGAGAQEKKQEFSIVVSNPSEPSLTVADQSIKFGNTLTFNLDSYLSNPSKLKVTYSIDNKPSQDFKMYTKNSNNVNNYVEWTPAEAKKGTNSLTVKATYTISGVQKEKTDIFNINVKGTSCLTIKDIDAKKGEDGTDSESGVDKTGGLIDEVEPGDKLKIEVELENTCDEETDNDHDIDGIEATVTLQEMADEGETDEDVTFDDLKSGESDSQTVTFSVPIDADEGSYEMTIEAFGDDEKSNDFYEIEPVKITVKVEKPNDKLKFKTFSLNPSTISCTKKTQLTLKLLNTGSSDEDVQLVLSSSELNIEEIELFELEEGDAEDDDTMYTKTYTFDVPSNAATGSYVITGKAYYNSDDDEEVETGSAILTVAGCGTTSTSTSGSSKQTQTYDSGADETNEEVEVVSTPAPVTTTTTTQTVTAEPPATTATTIGGEESFFESSLYIGLLVAGIIVVLLVIVVLIVAVSRR